MMNAIELLRNLVAIPSISGEETAAVNFLVQAMTRFGLQAAVDEAGNAVGVRECPGEGGQFTREILLLGHIDTVPGDIPVRVEGHALYGRGAVDAKGPLAAFVAAAAQAELTPGTRVVVVGAVEEESATSKGARHVASQYRPDCCIIGEPSGWDGVCLGYKGRLLIDYEHHQAMGHSAGKEQGAAETAVAFWNALKAVTDTFNAGRARLFDQLMPSLRQIQSGSDGLTNSTLMTIGVRLPPNFDVEAFARAAAQLAGDAELRFYAHEPAFQSHRRTGLAVAFNRAIRQAGTKPRFKLKTGTSDMNVVGPIWNCPILAYGPGDSSLDHTPDEHILLDEYNQAIGVLEYVLRQFSRYGE